MVLYSDLLKKLSEYLPETQVERVSEAYQVAEAAHLGQTRYTGEPYITHPVAVATILAHMHLDAESVIAAILHDVIEDTGLTKSEISTRFGPKVAELVDGVSKLTQIEFNNKEEAQAENFRKMMLAMAHDIRVILIKLADRLHNMRTLSGLPSEKRRRKAQETLEIYAPIAARLGMNQLRLEFEDLGFCALYPLRYKILKEAIRRSHKNRKELLDIIEKGLTQSLQKLPIPILALLGREKHVYSVYKKMHLKRLSFRDVFDVYAFRVIVDSVDACYRVLGAVHNFYKPVLGRFKDYIAVPKANGYQSLHSTLLGPYGVAVEVQIRTQDMDHLAENGIAAHWIYKGVGKTASPDTPVQKKTREWLKGLLELQEHTGSSLEFIEHVKVDLFPDEVYVFTPRGNILALPQGATPVDFAYSVHTDVGNNCVACKIDRRLAPLSTRLESGQTVEIITIPSACPSPTWLSFAVTGKARTNIRHWLKNQQQLGTVALGRRLIEQALGAFGSALTRISPEKKEDTLRRLYVNSLDDLCNEVGLGTRMAAIVAQHLMGAHEAPEGAVDALIIKGTEGLAVTYADCCYPIPGDHIIGCLSETGGLKIHQDSCAEARLSKHNAHRVHVQWESELKRDFSTKVRVDVINRRGVLAMIASTISESDSNILDISVDERDSHHNSLLFLLTVKSRAHLARLMRRLKALPEVTRIERLKPGH